MNAAAEARFFRGAIAIAAALVSVLLSIFFASERFWGLTSAAAYLLSLAILFLAWRLRAAPGRRLLAGVVVVLSAQFLLFVVVLDDAAQVNSPRLLQVSIAIFYVATVLSVALAGSRRIAGLSVFALSFSLATAVLLAEILLGIRMSAAGPADTVPRWVGRVDSHPSLGMVYQPHSVLKTYYPDNARAYFKEEDAGEARWVLNVQARNDASLQFRQDTPGRVRVAITLATLQPDWGIQLSLPHLGLTAGDRYAVEFRARADQPRPMAVGVTQGHAPWAALGLYEAVALGSPWQAFRKELVATATDGNAQVVFNVGASPFPVELEDVRLRNVESGRAVEPALPTNRYLVSYRFNALGCRGRDYAIPRPKGGVRILLLGDSFTLGAGVHEEDTFGRQLEDLLNREATTGNGEGYEVVNCGVSGYGTREERIHYELVSAAYAPDIVLLVASWNDDMSFFEEVHRGYINRQRGRLEQVFYTWALAQDYRHRRPSADFSKSVAEILLLNTQVRQQGGRLGVVLFRPDNSEVSQRLDAQLSGGVKASRIPLIDLGDAFREGHTANDLWVHPLEQHVNEIGQRIAAREILAFLRRENLLAP